MNKKYFHLLLLFIVIISCKKNDIKKSILDKQQVNFQEVQESELEKIRHLIEKELTICEPCSYDFNPKKINYLLSVFNKDKTLNKLHQELQKNK